MITVDIIDWYIIFGFCVLCGFALFFWSLFGRKEKPNVSGESLKEDKPIYGVNSVHPEPNNKPADSLPPRNSVSDDLMLF